MTLFEYLAIAFGLLFSVAALRLVGGLPSVVARDRRYGVHLALTLLHLLGIAASFWTFWSLRDVPWTFPRFLLTLTIPGLLYYCAAALVPENPEDVGSWRDHYYAMRRRYFVGFGLWGLATGIGAAVNLGMGLAHPGRAIHAIAILVGVVGSSSANPRVHTGIVSALAVMYASWAITMGLSPGWLAR